MTPYAPAGQQTAVNHDWTHARCALDRVYLFLRVWRGVGRTDGSHPTCDMALGMLTEH
eukprot:CAMPEP_0206174758 /NCGR_PEP_ID=MMETSP1474-20131121/52998_1 /ASSEMBLY_ACC=CAM_ASM_001110 /TAXON_ID=97495 /ORGANISM="Imantonia sp., Strain RCC918" /LENGTH=57 /DNA_ID=CAMNT_0053584527 /DNA_START=48 /DNA_END=219 /DNA_ORIENTATION=+